ncbi:solute carrier family 13 member 5-like [Ischnura elegans]|uniref:solute carrier family 13 member 5-like n=1 Tax=Ischnura elegans TaxID=197161 RepID=UPI001ED88589|nr:solute carrier family 13 member 5-like [Ischnura elegans]
MAESNPEGTPQAPQDETTDENTGETPLEGLSDPKADKWCGIFSCARYVDFEENGQGKNPTTFGYIYNIFLHWKIITLILTPLILTTLLRTDSSPKMLYAITVITMAIYWLTQAIPLPMTAMLPLVAFPVFGIEDTSKVAVTYTQGAVILYMGAFILYQAIEGCHLHERICLKLILMIGTSPKLLMFGVMFTTMLISIWIPNVAATAVMIPLLNSISRELNTTDDNTENSRRASEKIPFSKKQEVDKEGVSENILLEDNEEQLNEYMSTLNVSAPKEDSIFCQETHGLFLSVAYASTIGGTGSLVGTAVNVSLLGILDMVFPGNKRLSFDTWMLFSIPNMLVCTIFGWATLHLLYMKSFRDKVRKAKKSPGIHQVVLRKYERLGAVTYHECTVIIIFLICQILWLLRSPMFFQGWADALQEISIKDGTPVMMLVIILHILPATTDYLKCGINEGTHKVSPNVIGWKIIQEKMPWGLIILIGSGYSLTHGIQILELSQTLEEYFASLSNVPPIVLLFFTCVIATCLTQVASSVSIANILLPLIAYLSIAIKKNPLYLMLPTTICCSFSFMLPLGAPPNAIVYLASNMKKMDMAKSGVIMSIICVLVTIAMINCLGWILFDLDSSTEWINEAHNSTGPK